MVMKDAEARELIARERARIEAALAVLADNVRDEAQQERQQTGENAEAGSDLQAEALDTAIQADLRRQLEEVGRAEARIGAGTYGRSVESGSAIPDARLKVAPLAERTVEEQAAREDRSR
jgi:DnaK suppressor protein